MKILYGILYYGKPVLTEKCIDSLLRAAIDPQSILLLDNGSKETFETQIKTQRLPMNVGFTGGMNTLLRLGFKEYKADRVVLVSNDVCVPEDFHSRLKKIIEKQQSDSTAKILCPHIFFEKDRNQKSYTHGKVDTNKFELSHQFDESKSQITFPEYYPAAITVWDQKSFEVLGGFAPEYYCYWEDVDLALNASRKHVNLISSPELTAYHFGKGTTQSKKSYLDSFTSGKNLFATRFALLSKN